MLVVLDGQVTVDVDGAPHALVGGDAIVLPRGAPRTIVAGEDGVRYLTVHRRRGGLEIGRVSG
jgi:quercetin dioxygenase-like cupin family protein